MPLRRDSRGTGAERRRRPRVAVFWPLYLSRERSHCPLQSRTTNLSSEGFYCLVSIPFTVGEKILCDILIPSHVASALSLHCRATILRVETAGVESSYGIACRIEEYSVIRRPTIDPETGELLRRNGKTRMM
jgi:hypothetical protein